MIRFRASMISNNLFLPNDLACYPEYYDFSLELLIVSNTTIAHCFRMRFRCVR